jgi:3-oxoacyl-[acyl-carrier-protein] synthase II
MKEMKRVVVTGMGALTPIGNTLDEYWNNLINGVSGAAPITKFDASLFKTQFACEVKNFNAEDRIDRREARRLDLFSQYALFTAMEAVEDAGIDPEKVNLDRCGVIWGSGIGGLQTFQDEVLAFAAGDGTPRFNPFFIPKMIADIAAGHISMKFGFRGPNYVTVSACASSTNALIDAMMLIQLGKSDIIISGGSEAAVNIAGVGGFNALKALSFDATRDGFVLGEGSGCLILEELEHAKARGAKIYAEVVGSGLSADAHHITAPHPEGLGAKNVMRLALEEAGMQPSDIDYVNVHGTSTPLGDIAETKAIKAVFGEDAYNLNISSTKSMTGHLLGAAGAIEAIACVKSVQEDIIPPTINFGVEDENIDYKLNFTFGKAQKRVVRAALSNTFGFGGHNASIIVKKFND